MEHCSVCASLTKSLFILHSGLIVPLKPLPSTRYFKAKEKTYGNQTEIN